MLLARSFGTLFFHGICSTLTSISILCCSRLQEERTTTPQVVNIGRSEWISSISLCSTQSITPFRELSKVFAAKVRFVGNLSLTQIIIFVPLGEY